MKETCTHYHIVFSINEDSMYEQVKIEVSFMHGQKMWQAEVVEKL